MRTRREFTPVVDFMPSRIAPSVAVVALDHGEWSGACCGGHVAAHLRQVPVGSRMQSMIRRLCWRTHAAGQINC